MSFSFVIIISIIAGIGAGLGTGFAGMSAAVVITPILIGFLDVPPYTAVGIALASDVLASGVSSITYARHKNIDIKNGLYLMASVLCFTLLGSLIGSYLPSHAMGNASFFMTIFLGAKFIIKPVMATKEHMEALDPSSQKKKSILFGSGIGLICGLFGAGGGIMMLLVLTSILGYELKTAVGTSVFVMSFTALTGAVSHFVLGDTPDMLILTTCVISTLIFANIAAHIANRVDHKLLNRITGIVLVVIGVGILVLK